MGKQRYRSMHPNMLGMLKGKTVEMDIGRLYKE